MKILTKFIVFFIFSNVFCEILLFDIGGVTFKTNKLGVAREIGLARFINYALLDFKNPNIEKILFKILGQFGKQEGPSDELVRSDAGEAFPKAMCDWLAGTMRGADIIKLISLKKIESKRERRLLRRTINVIFDPEMLAKYTVPVKKCIRLIKRCLAKRDGDGKRKHRIMICSNLDGETFDLLMKSEHGKKIFKYFNPEDIIISAKVGLNKPGGDMYRYVIEKYNLDPSDCYLIDDQWENIKAAEKYGFKGLLLKNRNFRKLKKKMRKLGIID